MRYRVKQLMNFSRKNIFKRFGFVLVSSLVIWVFIWATYARPPLQGSIAALESDENVIVSLEPWITFLPVSNEKKIGFIFQQFNLINTLNALENVMLPMTFQNIPEGKRRIKAKELLELVGLKIELSIDQQNSQEVNNKGLQSQDHSLVILK